MVEGRQRNQWNHTAQVLAMLYNTHRAPKARALKPADFHPLLDRKSPVPKIQDLSILKQVFVKE
jgi:hypothetical protein